MSSIQIVPDDVGVAAAQIISDAVGNFSLNNRLNSSDLENLALEGAKEIGSGLKDVADVVSDLTIPLTLLFYVISIGIVVWIVLTLVEKSVLVLTYFSGNKRKGRGWGRGPCGSCCTRMKRWFIVSGKYIIDSNRLLIVLILQGRRYSRSRDRVIKVHPEMKSGSINNGDALVSKYEVNVDLDKQNPVL